MWVGLRPTWRVEPALQNHEAFFTRMILTTSGIRRKLRMMFAR